MFCCGIFGGIRLTSTGSTEQVAWHQHLLEFCDGLFLFTDFGLREAVVLLMVCLAVGDCCQTFSLCGNTCKLRTSETELEQSSGI